MIRRPLFALLLLAGSPCLLLAEEPLPAAAAEAAAGTSSPSMEALTEQVKKSVVVVTTAGRDSSTSGMGAGFILSADGLVVTNFHVIGDGREVQVRLADGRRLDVTGIHAFDRTLDLAVLRVAGKDLPALELGNSDQLKQGQSMLALGNPRGLTYSVVSGLVSGVREMEGRQMIQLAIPIEQGNSGGPLVDLQGRAHGVMTMKSLLTPNLGFAVAINQLKPLLEKPNPIPMARWLTIGALDPREWTTQLGSRWRQRAGRINVEGAGTGFGGRSLCLAERAVPPRPYELAVSVKLHDEDGAAGLACCADDQTRHYGFYPSNGKLRLTRFDGPELSDWHILHDAPSRHYQLGEFNTLRVRVEPGKLLCYVNEHLVTEVADGGLESGQVGLVKFRDTQAQFKNFRLGETVPRDVVPASEAEQIVKLVENLSDRPPLDERLTSLFAADPARAALVLRERAARLDRQAEQLRLLANAAHERKTINDLMSVIRAEEEKIDLPRACLLVARLDNEEVDVEAYCHELDQLSRDFNAKLPEMADDKTRLEKLRGYLFEENGFHGSRGDSYNNQANSYLNEVLDDREGLPITLSVVYLELANRAGLKVAGVGLPGHFVVAHVPAEGERQLIDVFEGATLLSREQAAKRLKESSDIELTENMLAPMTKRAIISRMIVNLLGVARSDRAANRYLNALLALEPENGPFHFARAMIRYRLDERDASREDVSWLIDHKPAGVDMTRVLALEAELDRE